MKLLTTTAVLLVSLLALQTDEEATKARGRALAALFSEGRIEALWDEFAPEMQAAMPLETLRQFHGQAADQLGAELAMLSESVLPSGETRTFIRKARYEKVPMVIETILALDSEDRVAGFLIRPVPEPAPTEYLDYATRAELHLPFEGEWDVFWGGRTIEQNYHVAVSDQRFAYDLLVMKDGQSHSGDPKRNESYHAFDRKILAPARGKVLVAVDGVEDNVPGVLNPRQAAGNHVILDLGNDEYALMAHFKKGTLAVKVGDEVTPETVLGRCGNSGNTTEPHLHFHLQDTPDFGKGRGLPAQFQHYLADGQAVERGEPVKGQKIRRQ